MTNIIVRDAQRALGTKLEKKQDALITFAALMGRGDGTDPRVAGREGYVWVRVGHAESLQMAYNVCVMPYDDLPIYVGYKPEQPNLLQVISVRQEEYVNTNQGVIPQVHDHHLTHEWGGGDDVWVAYRRMVDLHLGQPAGFVVTLNPGLVYRSGAYMWIPQQTLDLSGDQPGTGMQARYDLVYLDAAGTLSARAGTIRPNPTALLVSDIPIPLAGEIAIAAVRLYASQTEIGDDPDNRDIVELRDFQPYSAAGVHELLSATHDDTTAAACVLGDVITGQAGPVWARLAISVPVANVRNVLGVDNAETGPSWKAALDGNNPTTNAPGDAAAPGTSLIFSHRDHQHANPATWPATAHNLLSATHGDTVANGATRGSLVYGNSAPAWDELVIGGAAGSFLTRDANDVLWSTLTLPNAATTGDILYASGANAIGNLADVAVGSVLVSGGVGAAPAYSASPTLTGLTLSGLTASTVIYSNAGKAITSLANAAGVLTNDGAGGLSWVAGGVAHNLLSATHSDTTASAVAQGDLVVGVAGPSWDNLAVGGASELLNTDGTDVRWSGTNLTWDLTRLMAQIADAATNTIVYPFRVSHITSGTAAASFGVGIEFQNEDAAGTATITGIIASAWIDAAAANQESRIEFRASLKNVGTENPLIGVICAPTHVHGAGMSDGNARGYGAVDFQTYRNAATQVASGNYSAMLGGRLGTASGTVSTIVGGSENTCSGENAVVIGGYQNVAAGSRSVIIGGDNNEINAAATYSIASGLRATIGAHVGVFLFADGTDADFNSVAAGEFAIRARGKFRHAYDDSYYYTIDEASDGDVTFDITHAAGTPTFTFTHGVIINTLTASTVIYSNASKQIVSLANGAGVLTNDGAGGLSWGAAAAHALLSATHNDTVANGPTRGSLIYGNSTPAWDELVLGGASGSFLTRNATDVAWSGFYFSGTAGGTTTFAVTNTKTLTLTATDSYNLTIPATGTAALLGVANAFTNDNTIASGKFLTALTDGSTGGLRAGSGSDVLWYRGAANTWQTPDAVTIDGLLTVNADIQFPAVQVASADVNTLDDYEEGTVLVSLTCSTSGTITLNAASDTLAYTKIGRQVTLTGRITVDAVNAPVGHVVLNGLPFTCANSEEFYAAVSVRGANLVATATTSLTGIVLINTTTLRIEKYAAGSFAALAGDVQATTTFTLSVVYFTT